LGQPTCPIFRVQEIQDYLYFLTLKEEKDWLSRNVGKELPLYTA